MLYSRDDKRYTEKKNKSERARRKKEDTARLRGIVDVALSVDPRIKRIKQEEKAAREAKKKNKGGVNGTMDTKQKAEEEKKKAEEEAKKKEEEEKVCNLASPRQSVDSCLLSCPGCSCGGEESQGCGCQRREESEATATCRRGVIARSLVPSPRVSVSHLSVSL